MTRFIDDRNRVQVKVRKRPKPKRRFPGLWSPADPIFRVTDTPVRVYTNGMGLGKR